MIMYFEIKIFNMVQILVICPVLTLCNEHFGYFDCLNIKSR